MALLILIFGWIYRKIYLILSLNHLTMKATIILLLVIGSTLVAQQTVSLQTGKKNMYNDRRISDGKLIYTYYETDNKTISNAQIDIKSWEIEKEGISNEELTEGVIVSDNIRAQLKGNKLTIYDKAYKELASNEFTLQKGFSILHSSYTFDAENNRAIFYIVVGNNTYGWGDDKATGHFIYFDCTSNELTIKEIEAKTKDVSINGFLSSEVINNKVIMDIWAKNIKWGIFDLETGEFSGINFDAEASYFSYNVVTLNHVNYFIFRGGSSTSKSIFYIYDKIFKIDMETGNANNIALVGNTRNSFDNLGANFLVDKNQVRMNCGFIEYKKGEFINFSMYDDKIKILFIDGDEPSYQELETIKMSSLYSVFYKVDGDKIILVVDGSKQVKSQILSYEVDLNSKTLSAGKTISSIEPDFTTLALNDFYYDGEKDNRIDYSINKDKKTGQVTFKKND